MNNNEVRARCRDCGTVLEESDKKCPKCGSTKKAFRRKSDVVLVVGSKVKDVVRERPKVKGK